MQKVFTHLPEMDLEILYNMDAKDLINMCHLNKHIHTLCKQNKILSNKITTFKKLQLAFLYEPDINPETGKKLKLVVLPIKN